MKALKRQLDEAEEEISRERAQKRKTQRELEDSLQDNESKERELTNLKNKLRWVGRASRFAAKAQADNLCCSVHFDALTFAFDPSQELRG